MAHQRQSDLPSWALGRPDRPSSRAIARDDGRSTTGYSSGRERLVSGSDRRKTPQPTVKPSHPLLGEIERLMASCDAYEREIRSSQNTINHQLSEWSGKFDTLHDIDTKAEKMAFDIHRSIETTRQKHDARIARYVQDGEKIVDESRVNMEQWNIEDDGSVTKGGDKWEHLQSQIELAKQRMKTEGKTLKDQVNEKAKRERKKKAIGWICSSVALLFFLVIWFLLWAFEWRPPLRPTPGFIFLMTCLPVRKRRWTIPVVQCWSFSHCWNIAIYLKILDWVPWLWRKMQDTAERHEREEQEKKERSRLAREQWAIEQRQKRERSQEQKEERQGWRRTLQGAWERLQHRPSLSTLRDSIPYA